MRDPAQTTLKSSGFTLLEVVVALMLLGVICASLFVVMERCMVSVTDMIWERRAFEVARENLEQVLCRTSVNEQEDEDYGQSERYPQIAWGTTMDIYTDPIDGSLSWLKVVCTAEYEDTEGETQTVSLSHLLCSISESEDDPNQVDGFEDWKVYTSDNEAAADLGIDVEQIIEFKDNDMLLTDANLCIRHNCQIFIDAGGDPNEVERARQVTTEEQYEALMAQESEDADSSDQEEDL